MQSRSYVIASIFQGSAFNAMTLLVSVVAVAVAAGAFYYQRVSIPKRALEIKLGHPTPIATNAQGIRLTVTHGNVAIESPHITTLVMENSGRSDVSGGQFDGGRPLVVDFGVPIVEAIRTPDPTATFDPVWETVGSRITLGPTLIPRSRAIQFQVLTDGVPRVACQAHLVDTRVKVSKLEETSRQSGDDWTLLWGIGSGIVGTFLLIFGIHVFDSWDDDSHISVSPALVAPGQKINVTGGGFESAKPVYMALRCHGYAKDEDQLADAAGLVTVSFTIPKEKSWAAGEKCTVSAVQYDTSNDANATFVIQKAG